MKGLKKLALVSAIAMTSAGAFAMEAADDSVLSDTTGQSGITIDVAPGAITTPVLGVNSASNPTGVFGVSAATISAIDTGGTAGVVHGLTIGQVVVHDADGFTGATTAGAIVIGNGTPADSTVVFADDLNPIVIDVDAGVHATAGSILNVKITTPTLAIKTGAIYVAASNGVGSAVGTPTKVLNGMEIILGATTINVQLGHEAQTVAVGSPMGATVANVTALAAVNATLTGGLTINKTEIDDNGGTITGGAIYVGSMAIKDHAGTDLTAKVAVNVSSDLTDPTKLAGTCASCFANDPNATTGGLVITLGQLGTAAGGIDIAMSDVTLGKAAYDAAGAFDHAAGAKSLGDVEILGLNLNGTSLIIHGH